jgi:hypothetical protein
MRTTPTIFEEMIDGVGQRRGLPEPTENMLKVGEARDRNRAIDRAFQRAANKRSDTCRDAPNRLERALSCYVFKTGRSAISRRQVSSPVASQGTLA